MTADLQPRYEPEPEDEDMQPAPTDLTPKDLSGAGRSAIEARLLELQADRLKLATELAAARREIKDLTDNVTSLQRASTHAVTCARLDAAIAADPALASLLLELAWSVARARSIHPEGCSALALIEETGEVARALAREDEKRYRAELVDTATVATRLLLGDVDERLAPREPHAASLLMRIAPELSGDGEQS